MANGNKRTKSNHITSPAAQTRLRMTPIDVQNQRKRNKTRFLTNSIHPHLQVNIKTLLYKGEIIRETNIIRRPFPLMINTIWSICVHLAATLKGPFPNPYTPKG